MKLYRGSANAPFLGLYSRLAIIGVGQAAAGASDFTTAATSQIITVEALGLGDGVDYPLARLFCKQAPVGPAITSVAIKVGHTDDDDGFIASAALIVAGNSSSAILVTDASGGPNTVSAASKSVIATFTATGGNINTLTAGVYYLYYNLIEAKRFLEPTG